MSLGQRQPRGSQLGEDFRNSLGATAVPGDRVPPRLWRPDNAASVLVLGASWAG